MALENVYANNDKWETRNRSRNITSKSRKDYETVIKGKRQVIENTGSRHLETSGN